MITNLAGGHRAWVNGVPIGNAAPRQSGTDAAATMHRHKVPVGTLRKGEWNEIAIRVELPPEALRSGAVRGGFLEDAPFLMNYLKEGVLEGGWQFLPGDNHAVAHGQRGSALAERPAMATIDTFRDSSLVLGRAEQVHGPSLPLVESAAKFHAAAPFAVDLLLHERFIAQPFHVSFDERGRMWVTQSRQYPYPAGLKMVSRDRCCRSHYDRVPPAPPHHDRGADGRIARVRYVLPRHKAAYWIDPGRGRKPTAWPIYRRLNFLKGPPISFHHRESTGTVTTGCLPRITGCGKAGPSRSSSPGST